MSLKVLSELQYKAAPAFAKESAKYGTRRLYIGRERTEEEKKKVPVHLKERLKYQTVLKIVDQPSGNCQMSVIGFAETIFSTGYSREESLYILKEVFNHINTNALLFDIETYLVPELKDLLEDIEYEEIICETPYTNPTGTPMVLLYVQVKEYVNDEDDEENDYWDDDDWNEED